MSWKNKKHRVVAQSSTELEYRAMATTTYELVWIKKLRELKIGEIDWMELACDNQATFISHQIRCHERTKHIEIHFVRVKILSGDIVTKFVKSNDQVANYLHQVPPRPLY